MATKVCDKCYESKVLDDFHNSQKSQDGKNRYCKVCIYKYKKAQKLKSSETRENEKLRKCFREKLSIMVFLNKKDGVDIPLSVDHLHEIYKSQNGICTMSRSKLVPSRKATIYDRISFAKKDKNQPYSPTNIQMVSEFMNSFILK